MTRTLADLEFTPMDENREQNNNVRGKVVQNCIHCPLTLAIFVRKMFVPFDIQMVVYLQSSLRTR